MKRTNDVVVAGTSSPNEDVDSSQQQALEPDREEEEGHEVARAPFVVCALLSVSWSSSSRVHLTLSLDFTWCDPRGAAKSASVHPFFKSFRGIGACPDIGAKKK